MLKQLLKLGRVQRAMTVWLFSSLVKVQHLQIQTARVTIHLLLDEDVYNFGTNEAGVYYVKVTGQPAETSVKKKGGALFALPEGTKKTQGSEEAPIELKINTGAVEVSKEIVGGDIDTKSTTASAGDTVTFKLTASVTGSKEVPLTEYTIHDNLSGSFDTPAVTEVMVGDTKLQEGTDYTVDKTNLSDIQISLTSIILLMLKS